MPPNNQPPSFQPYTPTPPTQNPNFSNPPQPPIESKTSSSSGILVGVIVILLVIIAGLAFFYFTRTPALTTQTQAGTALPFGQAPVATPVAGTTTSNSSCQDNDWNCLLTAAQNCSLNSLITNGMNATVKYEIFGTQNSTCHYKESYLGGTVVLSQATIDSALKAGTSMAEIDSYRKFIQMAADKSAGKYTECNVPNAELVAHIQYLEKSVKDAEKGNATLDSNSPESQFIPTYCKSTLFSN